MNKRTFLVLALILIFSGQPLSQTGVKKKRPLPYEYGRVIINNYSDKTDLAPVVFEHWDPPFEIHLQNLSRGRRLRHEGWGH